MRLRLCIACSTTFTLLTAAVPALAQSSNVSISGLIDGGIYRSSRACSWSQTPVRRSAGLRRLWTTHSA